MDVDVAMATFLIIIIIIGIIDYNYSLLISHLI